MDEDPPEEQAPEQGGVFGNLPRSRPGPRSPRRRSSEEPKRPAAKQATARRPASRKTAPKHGPAEAKPLAQPAPERTDDRPAEPPEGGPGGIEEIAWAGVAVAAEAATIGVRLASRAIEALRGSPEREER